MLDVSMNARILTFACSDRVMVLDAGRIVEFDAPDTLRHQTGSVFSGMCKAAGL